MYEVATVIVALIFLQFMRGYYASKGYSQLKMAIIGGALSAFTLSIYILSLWVSSGEEVISRVKDPKGIAIGLGFVVIFSVTYAFYPRKE